MSPLHIFLDVAKALAKQPVHFWPASNQKKLPSTAATAIAHLKKTLESNQLEDTIAYKTITALQNTIKQNTIDELFFIQSLATLVEVYQQAPSDETTKNLLNELNATVVRAKKRILEYHLALEALRKKSKTMNPLELQQSDRQIIQNVGFFYVLEYTLQVFYEWPRLSAAQKEQLLKTGLQTPAGNLPAYLPLEDTFRNELCLKIFDEKLRNDLLHAFYKFEEILYNNDIIAIGAALKQFNKALLVAFQNKGITTFKATIYKPFGDDLPIAELIKKVEMVKV